MPRDYKHVWVLVPTRVDIMLPDGRLGGASSPALDQLREAYQTSKTYKTQEDATKDLRKLKKEEK